jgi:hypothetical protein
MVDTSVLAKSKWIRGSTTIYLKIDEWIRNGAQKVESSEMILQETVNPNFRIRANLEDNDDPLSETNKLLPREVTMNSWKFSLSSPQDRCVPVLLCLLCAALSPSIVGRASDATKSRGNLIHKRRVGLERSLVCVVIVTFCLPIISCMGHNCSPGSLDWYTIYVYYTWAGAPRFWGPGAVALERIVWAPRGGGWIGATQILILFPI